MQQTRIQEEPDPEEPLNQTQYPIIKKEEIIKLDICKFTLENKETQETLAPLTETWIARAMNFSTELAQKENAKKRRHTNSPRNGTPRIT